LYLCIAFDSLDTASATALHSRQGGSLASCLSESVDQTKTLGLASSMNTCKDHAKYLDTCGAALADKPRLASIFNRQWRTEFREKILTHPDNSTPGYPTVYWLPMLHQMCPDKFPIDLHDRCEHALDVVWDQMTERDLADLTARLRDGDFSTLEELLAITAFAKKFGRSAIIWPVSPPDQRKPEFFVESEGTRWAVECRHLHDREEVRKANEVMFQTGEPWILPELPGKDQERLRNAIIKKILRAQGCGPTIILLTSLTPWLGPNEMKETVLAIFDQPNEYGLKDDDLPIAISCHFWTIVQGIWFCEAACAQVGAFADLKEYIRDAILSGFVPHPNTQLLNCVS
jgi:hypothetical protein